MHIALVNTLYPPDGIGGSERSTECLAKGLVKKGHTVSVICQGISEKTSRQPQDGAHVIRLGTPPGFQPNVFAEPREVIERLKKKNRLLHSPVHIQIISEITRLKPDVVHLGVVPNPAYLWRSLAELDFPFVQTLRSYSMMCKLRMFRGNRPCMDWCDNCRQAHEARITGSQSVSAIVGISTFILRTFLDNGFFSKAIVKDVIPNSYESPETSPLPFLKNGRLTIGYIGRIHQSKGVNLLLEQAHNPEFSKIRFIFAGGGNKEYIAHLKKRYARENIEFLGHISSVKFFDQTDIVVIPSLWNEPFGRVTMEALHHGRPVLGTNRGGIPEIVNHNITGWVFNPDDPAGLSRLIKEILAVPAASLTQIHKNCLEAAKTYSLEQVAGAYENVYKQIIS